MKKEIIVNASKDRSRIAIVEDGELVELYVEHPDNVRTLGNIYLARIRKVMPAIRAAFVDIGQKQDAFLHFSDLTDNLGELLTIVGEQVPGQKTRVLSQAPQKRIADDENEPDVEDALELESNGKNSDSKKRSSRRGRSNRSRNHSRQHRRRPRNEEEEQEETREDATPFVIDLTFKPGRMQKPASRDRKKDKEPESETSAEETQDRDTDGQAEEERKPIVGIGTIDLTRDAVASSGEEKREKRISRAGGRPSNRPSNGQDTKEQDPPKEETVAQDPGEDSDREDDVSAEKQEVVERRRRRRRGRRGGRRNRRSDDDESSSDDSSDEKRGKAESKQKQADRPKSRDREDASNTRSTDRERGKQAKHKAETEKEKSDSGSETKEKTRSSSRQSSNGNRSKKAGNKDGGSQKKESRREPEAPSVRPDEMLKRDGRILVKVTKEPISNKGSRVSTDISFAGRFLVLVPAADYVAVSKKIESARERRRLRTLASKLKPEGFGVIVRTVAAGKDTKTLDTDLGLLLDKWRKIEKTLDSKASPPELLYEDVNMVSSIIRDLFTEDYDRILVDDPKLHRNIKAYIQAVAPHMADRVKLHRSNTPVFRAAGIERAVEQVFSPRVPLPGGGYLFIEHTEAMHVIDVNSGRAGRGKSQAENLLNVNLEAAHEIAKQLRLRDLGGIIVVDFIDMYQESDRRKVYQAMKREFTKDRAVTKLLPMSDFGLMEITRQRLRPSITATGGEGDDPVSAMEAAGATEIIQPKRNFGPEELDAPLSHKEVGDQIDAWLKNYNARVADRYRGRPIVIRIHPLLESYLRRGFPSRILRWRFGIKGIKFSFEINSALHPLDFDVCDKKSGKSLKARFMP
ncbi:MAG: Rne/Rng family ribonuclease [Rubricoccaceae bacterium]|nr:Rne/Rng family ribonuclease [Rubricoccaceae bacterium]